MLQPIIMLPLFYISQITCRPAILPHLPIQVRIQLPRPNPLETRPTGPVSTQVEFLQEILAQTRPISQVYHKTRARTRPISPAFHTTRARTRPHSPAHHTTRARTRPISPVATQVGILRDIRARTRPISPVHRTTRARTRPADPVATQVEILREILAQARLISPVYLTSQPSLRLRQATPITRVPPRA